MHAFTAAMQTLRETLDSVAKTSCATLPDFARDALEGAWVQLTPMPHATLIPSVITPQSAAEAIANCMQAGDMTQARRLAVHLLAEFGSFFDRVWCIEQLGTDRLGPLFFVDDVAGPYSDLLSLEAIMEEGLGKYAKLAKAAFNFGPSKTASMACFDAPTAESHVDVYKIMGVEMDRHFTFKQRLNVVCAMGRSAFEEFFHMAESAGFSVPVEAMETPLRLEPLVLYGSEMLVLAEGAESRLNQLQAAWAKAIVGCRHATEVRGILAVAECGWGMSLGTAMIERAIIAMARISLLHEAHPIRRLLQITMELPCDSWTRRVQGTMSDSRLALSPSCQFMNVN